MILLLDISLEIANRLADFTEDVQEALEESASEVTEEAIKTLKATSPTRTKKYAKSWIRKKTSHGYVIHNKRYYLTHLLEHGHAKRGGGRVEGIKHIEPVEQQAIESFEQRVREKLQ